MKRGRRSAVVAALVLVLIACDESLTAPTRANLLGQWPLMSIQQRDGSVLTPRAGTNVGIEFLDEDRVAVQSDCNICSGRYALDGATFRVLPLACTRRACLVGSIEGPYLELLSAASSARISSGRALRLEGSAGTLTFVR